MAFLLHFDTDCRSQFVASLVFSITQSQLGSLLLVSAYFQDWFYASNVHTRLEILGQIEQHIITDILHLSLKYLRPNFACFKMCFQLDCL